MAAARIALRKLLVPPRLVNTAAHLVSSTAAPFGHSFSSDAQVTPSDDMSSSVDVRGQGRSVSRRARNRKTATTLFSDIFDPFVSTRSLSHVLNLMDQFLDDPLFNRNWDVTEDDDALHLHIDMPGLSKEEVKVTVEGNTLVIRGEGQKEEVDVGDDSEGGGRRRYTGRIGLPKNRYKADETKAEMKHGVLKVLVPKVKDGERQGVMEVAVDG